MDERKHVLREIFASYPNVIAVYLFGSFLENPESARDVDLAVLTEPPENLPELYLSLYRDLKGVFTPREVDILFLRHIPLSLAFEIVRTSRALYVQNEERKTDFEDSITERYLDYLYHLKRAEEELFEAIREEYLRVQQGPRH